MKRNNKLKIIISSTLLVGIGGMTYAMNQVFADERDSFENPKDQQLLLMKTDDDLNIKKLPQALKTLEVTKLSEQILEVTTGSAIEVNIESGMVEKNTEVNLMTNTTGSSIHFTLNGVEPEPNTTGTSIWLAPMKIKNDTLIQARVYRQGKSISDLYKFEYLVQDAVSLNIISEKPTYTEGELAKIKLEIANRKLTNEDVTLVVEQYDESGKIIDKSITTQNIKTMSKSRFQINTKVLKQSKELKCCVIDNLQNKKILEDTVILKVE